MSRSGLSYDAMFDCGGTGAGAGALVTVFFLTSMLYINIYIYSTLTAQEIVVIFRNGTNSGCYTSQIFLFMDRFNMYIDDLPIWGEMAFLKKPVEGGEEDVYVYVHKKLTIHHNGPYIIKLDLKMENEEKLELEKEIEYTYEVCLCNL